MNNTIRWSSLLAAAALFSFAAQAETPAWPTRLIKAVIPFGAGSATDVVPRLVFDRLAAELGQSIVVENRAGAGGTLGTAIVARADPDGYTILGHSSALTIAPAIYPDLSYDVNKDLVPTLMIGSSANVMIVPITRPWQSIQDFLAAAKAKDAAITFGSVGVGSAVHIAAEKFRIAAGFTPTHVPYRGGAEVIADIMGGRIDFYFCPLSTALPLIKDQRVRALVVSSAKRVPELPDVPTLSEAGLKDAESNSWFAVFMPAKTPRAIVDKFHDVGAKLLATPEMQASLKKLAVETEPMSIPQMEDFIRNEVAANGKLIKTAGIK